MLSLFSQYAYSIYMLNIKYVEYDLIMLKSNHIFDSRNRNPTGYILQGYRAKYLPFCDGSQSQTNVESWYQVPADIAAWQILTKQIYNAEIKNLSLPTFFPPMSVFLFFFLEKNKTLQAFLTMIILNELDIMAIFSGIVTIKWISPFFM